MPQDPIVQAFDRLVERGPARPLLEAPGRSVTRDDLRRLSRTVAEVLDREGRGSGDLVGFAAPNGAAFLGGLLGLRRRGCGVLLLDARAPRAEQRRIVRSLGGRALLACDHAWPRSGADLRLLPVADAEEGTAAARDWSPEFVKLTSGSTGAPRGIVTPSEALLADDRALAATMGLGADERILAAIPLSHSYGLSSVALPCLVRGSVLVVPEEGQPLSAMAAARDGRVTFLPTVPAYLKALLKLSKPPRRPPALRLVVAAGEPLARETAARFRRLYDLPVHVFYGASECGGITFDRAGTAGERGALGTPVDGVEVTLEPLPDDEVAGRGRVAVRSPAVAAGYLPDADERLAGGRFLTADLGSFEDGELVLLGRVDDWINVKGRKVNPREVESWLGRLDEIEEVVVVGAPAADGEGEVVRAVVVRRGEAPLDLETVQRRCRGRLAEHKLPRSLILVPEIPRTERGKVDRAALRGAPGR